MGCEFDLAFEAFRNRKARVRVGLDHGQNKDSGRANLVLMYFRGVPFEMKRCTPKTR